MIREPIAFPEGVRMTRANAAAMVQVASRYEARVMIERAHKIVNAKSMLGLLSLYVDTQDGMMLLAEGPDEREAADAVQALVQQLGK